MDNVFFVGMNGDNKFIAHIPKETVVEVLKQALIGDDDHLIDAQLELLLPQEAAVLNALSWESEIFIRKMIEIVNTDDDRFAVKHGALKFGVASNPESASLTFFNEEF